MLTSFSALQDGTIPLYMASQKGHVSIVDILLRNGADPNLADTVSLLLIPILCSIHVFTILESILTTVWVNCFAVEKQLASNTQPEPSKPSTN